MSVETYGGYDYSGNQMSGGLYTYVYRQAMPEDRSKNVVLDSLLSQEREYPRAGYHFHKSEQSDKVVDGVPCTEVTYYIDENGVPVVQRRLVFIGARSVRMIDLVWWQDDKGGEDDYARLVKSVKFLPNEPGGISWQTGVGRGQPAIPAKS